MTNTAYCPFWETALNSASETANERIFLNWKPKKKKIQSDTPLYVYFSYPLSERNYVISFKQADKCCALDNRTVIVRKITDTSIGKVNKDGNLHKYNL